MQKHTRSILDELSNVSFTKDKENVVESRASHIIESAIRLITYIRNKFTKGVARIKENQDIKNNVLKIKDGDYKED
jgi:hypothetical protein